MIIEATNGKIELCDISYNDFLDSIKRENERDFIRKMEIVDKNENVDWIIRTNDYKLDYVSVDDIVFRKADDFFHVRYSDYPKAIKFKVRFFKEEWR